MHIRPMTSDESPQLADLFLKSRQKTFDWVDPACFQHQDFATQTEGETIWVATRGGDICGFLALWQPDYFIHHLYVDSQWYGQGTGRALLEHVLANALCPPTLKVAMRNHAALGFYHHLGWQTTGETGHCEITGPWCKLIARWPS
ncbi:MAG: GNAT family N-acetyltransferase, partial [Aeromonas sp.]